MTHAPIVDAFWATAPGEGDWAAMVAKYEALAAVAELAAKPRGPDYREALTTISARWPGALRESELIGTAAVAARHRAALRGAAEPTRPRGTWPDDASRAVLLWAELHPSIADLLEYRRRHGSASAAFASWISTHPGHERWPQPERVPELLGPRLRARSAYLWLAARSGLSLPQLNALLFARSGHWDRRAGDPEWAHS